MRILVRKQSQRPSTGQEVPPLLRNAENYAPRTSIAQAVDIIMIRTNAQNRTAHLLRALTKTRVIFIRKNAIQVHLDRPSRNLFKTKETGLIPILPTWK